MGTGFFGEWFKGVDRVTRGEGIFASSVRVVDIVRHNQGGNRKCLGERTYCAHRGKGKRPWVGQGRKRFVLDKRIVKLCVK